MERVREREIKYNLVWQSHKSFARSPRIGSVFSVEELLARNRELKLKLSEMSLKDRRKKAKILIDSCIRLSGLIADIEIRRRLRKIINFWKPIAYPDLLPPEDLSLKPTFKADTSISYSEKYKPLIGGLEQLYAVSRLTWGLVKPSVQSYHPVVVRVESVHEKNWTSLLLKFDYNRGAIVVPGLSEVLIDWETDIGKPFAFPIEVIPKGPSASRSSR